ncbi:hypothetical protein MAR_019867 [Mya arenaria]|uniref:C-type lectin domain-containing protein n=1 Tax=Mya arenaria TaxID=6604 RepID=A0ABY7E385_MYAAR|nr:hypothetical protein MAR_019867 [Mya arenaria]
MEIHVRDSPVSFFEWHLSQPEKVQMPTVKYKPKVPLKLFKNKRGHSLPQLLTGCPNGWIAYEGSCYLFNNKDMMSFVMAEAFCSQKGGHVVHVDDEEENNFIKDAARMYPSNSCINLKLLLIDL